MKRPFRYFSQRRTQTVRPPIRPFEYSSELHSRNIRLIYLEFGTGHDAIRTRLIDTNLDEAPSYVALSYTWGDPGDTCNILCNNQSLTVTRNLHAALWRIRELKGKFRPQGARPDSDERSDSDEGPDSDEGAFVWADAICINQGDAREKTEQVQLMPEIYGLVHFVVAWFGEANASTRKGLQLPPSCQRSWWSLPKLVVWSRPGSYGI